MRKKLILLMGIFSLGIIHAQVGINTNSPKALLHIQETDADNPSDKDGILIPRISVFPSISPSESGNLVFLEKAAGSSLTQEDGFYFWNGKKWVHWIATEILRHEFRNIYIAQGIGFTGVSGDDTTIRSVILNELIYNPNHEEPSNIFSLNTSNNSITIGKSGTYFVSLIISSRKWSTTTSIFPQINVIASIWKNSSVLLARSEGSTSRENRGATQVIAEGLVPLKKGDNINISVSRASASPTILPEYEGEGINSLALYYLY